MILQIFGSSTGMRVALTLSVFSDQVLSTYTTAKGSSAQTAWNKKSADTIFLVKQAIAWQRIIPFYRFFGQQNTSFDSPGGALLLHWIFTVIPLASLNTRSDTREFYSGIYSYGYQIMWGKFQDLCFATRGNERLYFDLDSVPWDRAIAT